VYHGLGSRQRVDAERLVADDEGVAGPHVVTEDAGLGRGHVGGRLVRLHLAGRIVGGDDRAVGPVPAEQRDATVVVEG
jgi:hypothetical protein